MHLRMQSKNCALASMVGLHCRSAGSLRLIQSLYYADIVRLDLVVQINVSIYNKFLNISLSLLCT
jgi:hypothetical protein